MTGRAARLAAARRAGLSGRDLILATMSEDQFTDHVVEWARAGMWCGVHLRQSHLAGGGRGGAGMAALRGIHTRQHHGHDDSFGLPDWFFWRTVKFLGEPGEVAESFYAELKVWGESPRPDQVRVIAALRAAGQEVHVWNPLNGEEARARFIAAPPAIGEIRDRREPPSQATRDVADLVRAKQREILEQRAGLLPDRGREA